MQISKAQFATIDAHYLRSSLEDSLIDFENDMKPTDQKLADDIATYRRAGNMDIFQRIIALTNIGAYERALLAMILQSGIDFTTDKNFDYIIKNPALSGNTKARHIILMAVAMNQSRDQGI